MPSSGNSNSDSSRAERISAYSAISIFALALLAFLAILLAPLLGVEDMSAPPWPTIVVFPLIGLPIAFVLIIVVIALNWRRR